MTEKWLGRPGQPRWMRNEDGQLVREDGMTTVDPKRQCAKCDQREAGTGNVLCNECKEAMS